MGVGQLRLLTGVGKQIDELFRKLKFAMSSITAIGLRVKEIFFCKVDC
jgi:hypothetical protein